MHPLFLLIVAAGMCAASEAEIARQRRRRRLRIKVGITALVVVAFLAAGWWMFR